VVWWVGGLMTLGCSERVGRWSFGMAEGALTVAFRNE